MFCYPLFCSAVFCSKPVEGSGRQRKCTKGEAKMDTCAFWLSSKGGGQRGRQRGGKGRKRAWGSNKMRKGSENAQGQRKCARAARKGSKNAQGQRARAARKGSAQGQRKCAFLRYLFLRCQFYSKLEAQG